MKTDMTGKVAVVTAAAAALGLGTAIKLGEYGAAVLLIDPDAGALEAAVAKVRATGASAHAHCTDITDADNCARAIAEAKSVFGGIDALCNIATAFYPAPAAQMSVADWNTTLALNLSAPFFLTQAAIPHLLERNGSVVNISSCAAIMVQPYAVAYGTTKAGLNHMTRTLAGEFIDQPIRFNAIVVGSMAMDSGSNVQIPKDVDVSVFLRTAPSRPLITIGELAEVIAYLASDASRGFNGACLSMDNGLSLGVTSGT